MPVTLRDGRSVTVRAVGPQDAEALHVAFDHVSADARYSRFMGTVRITPEAVERAFRNLAGRAQGLAAFAVEGAGEAIVGGASYVVGDDGESCEFAITITDGWRGAGLASRLMRALIADAATRGLKRMEGYVLARNKPMLDLARRLQFEVGPSDMGSSVRLVRLDLAAVTTPAP